MGGRFVTQLWATCRGFPPGTGGESGEQGTERRDIQHPRHRGDTVWVLSVGRRLDWLGVGWGRLTVRQGGSGSVRPANEHQTDP